MPIKTCNYANSGVYCWLQSVAGRKSLRGWFIVKREDPLFTVSTCSILAPLYSINMQ